MTLTRSTSIRVCTGLLRISNKLAKESVERLNKGILKPARSAKILVGLNIRDYLRGIRVLMNSNLDNQALVLFRSLIENYMVMHYLSKPTNRNGRKLRTDHKGLLYISFPMVSGGLKDQTSQPADQFKRALKHRLRITKDHRNWHGSTLRGICAELDAVRKDGKTPMLNTYSGVYSDLSFVSHPNSRESAFFNVDPSTGEIHLADHFHLNLTGLFATMHATVSMRLWAVAIKSKHLDEIEEFGNSLKQLVPHTAA